MFSGLVERKGLNPNMWPYAATPLVEEPARFNKPPPNSNASNHHSSAIA